MSSGPSHPYSKNQDATTLHLNMPADPAAPKAPPPPQSDTSTITKTITRPGAVRINVQGAFIVNEDPNTPPATQSNGAQHDTKDIRLPNHTDVVSHVAVDVGAAPVSDLSLGR